MDDGVLLRLKRKMMGAENTNKIVEGNFKEETEIITANKCIEKRKFEKEEGKERKVMEEDVER